MRLLLPTRGAQPGNQNARRKHQRLAVSFSGTLLDLVYLKLAAQGEHEPTEERVKEFIKQLVSEQVIKVRDL